MSALGDQLQQIREKHGALTAPIVVDEARDPKHPLHSRFEWDDSIAGEKFRLEQARQLIRIVKLPKQPGEKGHLRAFLAVKAGTHHRADYVPTQEVMANEFTRELVLREMRREWKIFKRRYEHMAEFAAMIAGEDEVAAAS